MSRNTHQLIRDAKVALSRYRKVLFKWAMDELPGDDEDDPKAPVSEEQLRKLMAVVILAEVDLGTDEMPNHTTQLTQVLRLMLQEIKQVPMSFINVPVSKLHELADKAEQILIDQGLE